MKSQPTEQEKIFANDANDKVLISKLMQLNIKKQTNKKNNKKIGRRSKQTFFQRRHTDVHHQLNIREIQIRTTVRYHLTLGQNGHYQKVYK